MDNYFNGTKLYGDDFSPEELLIWYNEEAEGYADLIGDDESKTVYGYHEINKLHGFNKLNSSHKCNFWISQMY